MDALLFLAAVSFGICLLLTPLCREIFLHAGLVDRPDQLRKMHPGPIPRAGGIPIAIAYVGSMGLMVLSPVHAGAVLGFSTLLPALGLIFATGLIDDVAGLKPWQKLLGETAAALAAYLGGVEIGTGEWWSLPLTVLWLVICANAFNLIDGIDGLAAGLGLLAAIATLGVALLRGDRALALASAPLAGALLGFLRYNFNPASIFLGDSGSLLVGFLLGCFGVAWGRPSGTLYGMTAPLMALVIPVLDVLLSILRRFLARKPIFGADRGHLHHRLLDRGLSQRKAAVLLYGLGALAAVFSIAQSLAPRGLAVVAFTVCVSFFVGKLRYPEFHGSSIQLEKLETSLANAVSASDSFR